MVLDIDSPARKAGQFTDAQSHIEQSPDHALFAWGPARVGQSIRLVRGQRLTLESAEYRTLLVYIALSLLTVKLQNTYGPLSLNSAILVFSGGVVFLITRRKQFGPSTFLWDVKAPDVARAARPGHFIMARIDERGERIPLTVADFNVERGTVTVVIQAVGKTTFEMMTLREGDTILDFIGPLGLPSQIRKLDLMARWCWWAAASA